MSDIKLKTCPFCGKFPVLLSWYDEVGWYYYACENNDCKIQPFTDAYTDKNEAIEDWNTRAED